MGYMNLGALAGNRPISDAVIAAFGDRVSDLESQAPGSITNARAQTLLTDIRSYTDFPQKNNYLARTQAVIRTNPDTQAVMALPRTQVRPSASTPTVNPYADRDARIAESQRLAAARKATSIGPTTVAGKLAPSGKSGSGFDWNSLTNIVGSIAGATQTILNSRNPQPLVSEPETTSGISGKSIAVVGGVVVAGIVLMTLLSGGKKSAE